MEKIKNRLKSKWWRQHWVDQVMIWGTVCLIVGSILYNIYKEFLILDFLTK